jgi:hypothetical protein
VDPIEVIAGTDQAGLDGPLTPARKFRGRVIDADGNPVARAGVAD